MKMIVMTTLCSAAAAVVVMRVMEMVEEEGEAVEGAVFRI